MKTKINTKKFEEKLKEILNKVYGGYFSSPSYYYWSDKQPADKYFYTIEKINYKGGQKYVAGIYRYLKSKKQFKLVKQVGFAKKKNAIDWAYKAYQDKK